MGCFQSKKVKVNTNLNFNFFEEKMDNTERLVSNLGNPKSISLLQSYGLALSKVAWEDTARTKNSCLGPNISDMTLVTYPGKNLRPQGGRLPCNLMPVIRKPNFADVTYDVPIESFKLLSDEGKVVSLKTFLESYNVEGGNKVLCDRDNVVLTSTQCCILPVEKGKKTEFAVQLFNYQSGHDDPAVMVILASKHGTSVRFVSSNDTRLMFDDKGKARWFSVERLEDSRERRGEVKTRVDSYKEMKTEEQLENTLLMIQVPLKQKERPRRQYEDDTFESMFCNGLEGSMGGKDGCMGGMSWDWDNKKKSFGKGRSVQPKSGMDMGQIGLGRTDGIYPSVKGKKIVRDERFPIRVTVQYYRVSDSSDILEKDVKDIADQLTSVVQKSVASGSLVFEKTDRITEPDLPANPVVDWGANVMV